MSGLTVEFPEFNVAVQFTANGLRQGGSLALAESILRTAQDIGDVHGPPLGGFASRGHLPVDGLARYSDR